MTDLTLPKNWVRTIWIVCPTFIAIGLILLFCGTLRAEQECQLTVVVWKNAQVFEGPNAEVNPDTLLSNEISFGCSIVGKDSIAIVTRQTNGQVTSYVVIPKASVVSVIFLHPIEDHDEPITPQKYRQSKGKQWNPTPKKPTTPIRANGYEP